MNWISVDEKLPHEEEFFFVWVPELSGYGNVAHGDIAYWDGSYWSGGNFPTNLRIEDGAPVSHWSYIEEPQPNTSAQPTGVPTADEEGL